MAPRVLFLFSDTGGGHRASATAVAAALRESHPGRFEIELLDPFAVGSGSFLRWLVYRYGWLIKNMPALYGLIFHGTNNRAVMSAAIRVFGNQFRPGLRKNLTAGAPVAVVSFHPLTNHVVLEVMRSMDLRVPFVTVITDMTDLHKMWMAPGANMVVVPSADARQYCVEQGLDPRAVFVAGLPVDPRFTGPLDPAARRALRARLGLADITTILLVSGGEGSGRLGRYAAALDNAGLPLQLVVVCGRNERLRRRLAKRAWKGPVTVLGFADNMPELMQASDAIVTKAGPGTISEALISGLPILLTGFVPGQEEGNVKFVVEHRVGWYTPRPKKLVARIAWAVGEGRAEFDRTRGRADALGTPRAAREIAQLVAAAVAAGTTSSQGERGG